MRIFFMDLAKMGISQRGLCVNLNSLPNPGDEICYQAATLLWDLCASAL